MPGKESVKKIDLEVKKLKSELEKKRKKGSSSNVKFGYNTFSLIF